MYAHCATGKKFSTTLFLPFGPTLVELVSFSNPDLKDVIRFPLPSPLIQLSTAPAKNVSPPFSDKVREKAVKMLSTLAGNSLSLNYNVTTTTR